MKVFVWYWLIKYELKFIEITIVGVIIKLILVAIIKCLKFFTKEKFFEIFKQSISNLKKSIIALIIATIAVNLIAKIKFLIVIIIFCLKECLLGLN